MKPQAFAATIALLGSVAILPAAQAHLTAEDWAELDLAFAANQDPLAGHGSMEQYRSVVQTILNNAPAPIGLG